MKINAGRISGVLLTLCLLLDALSTPPAAVENRFPLPDTAEESLFFAPPEPEAGEEPFFLTPETEENPVPAETGEMRTSEAGIAFIKEFEDFTPKVIADVGQWVIGYGCRCDPDDYPEGITEEEAGQLMREALSPMEESLNDYIRDCGVTLTQAQFDALSSMTYNMGAAWIGQDYRIWNMIREGVWNYSDNEIANAIGVFCHIGTQFSGSLARRRAREAQLFLYGDYTGLESRPVHYVSFEEESGELELETDVLFYTAGSKFRTLPTISSEGCHFDGWYTSDGTRLDIGDTVGQNLEVTACWSETPVARPADTPDFSDVKQDDWFAFYVRELHAANIISGYADNSFHPHAAVTNGEALKLVLLACGFTREPGVSEHWAGGYRELALEYDFLREEDLSAGLDAPASRAMIAALTANALGLKCRDGSRSPFADTGAEGPVALFQAGIMEGSVDSRGVRSFYPDRPVSRAEAAKIVWNIYHPSARF